MDLKFVFLLVMFIFLVYLNIKKLKKRFKKTKLLFLIISIVLRSLSSSLLHHLWIVHDDPHRLHLRILIRKRGALESQIIRQLALQLRRRQLIWVQFVIEAHRLEVGAVLVHEIRQHHALRDGDHARGLDFFLRLWQLAALDLRLLDGVLAHLLLVGAHRGVDGDADARVVLERRALAFVALEAGVVHDGLGELVVVTSGADLVDVLPALLLVLLAADFCDGARLFLLVRGSDLDATHI